MKLIFLFARRFFFGKKKHQSINLITRIAAGGIAVGSCALIILLSAFNGLEDWAIELNNNIDADLKALPSNYAFFELNAEKEKKLNQLLGPKNWSPIREGNALAIYGEQQTVVTIKGVSPHYFNICSLADVVVDGEATIGPDNFPKAIAGVGVAYQLGLSTVQFEKALQLYVPKEDADFNNLLAAFKQFRLPVAGIVQTQPEFDDRYILVPHSVTQTLFSDSAFFSSIEVKMPNGAQENDIKPKLRAILGSQFNIQNRFEQHQLLYKIIRSEKWMLYLILTLILIIATFTLFGSVSMIIVDKQKEIQTLRFLGLKQSRIQLIFFFTGLLITLIGAFVGILLGLLISWLQLKFSLVMVNEIDAYPILLNWRDFVLVFLTVLGVGALTSYIPSLKSSSI